MGKHMSDIIKGKILAYRDSGMTLNEIKNRTNIAISTLSKF